MAKAKDGIEYLIEAKVNQAIKNLNKFDQKTAQSQSKTTGSLSKIKGAWIAAAAVIGGVVVGSVIALGKKMVQASIEMEQTRVAFNTFLGSAEKGTKTLKELEQFSIVTPFTINQVNKAGKTLLAFGFQADELQDTLRFLGDVSAGTGKDLSEMAIIFGQIKGAGRLMGQDLLQLINAGFNPLQQISKKTGKSMFELKKEMEKGAISFDMVKEAFKDATGEGGLFFDLMNKQSKTLGGRISTLQGNVQLLAARIGDKLAPTVGKVVDFLNKFIVVEKTLSGELKEQKEELIKNQRQLNAQLEILKKGEIPLRQRERVIGEVNEALGKLNLEQIDQNTSLQEFNRLQKEANTLFVKRIKLIATREILAKKEEEAAKIAAKIIENEIDITDSLLFIERLKNGEATRGRTAAGRTIQVLKERIATAKKQNIESEKELGLIRTQIERVQELTGVTLESEKKKTDAVVESVKKRNVAKAKLSAKDKELIAKEKEVAKVKKEILQASFDFAAGLIDQLFEKKKKELQDETDLLLESIPARKELEDIAAEEEKERIAELEAERDIALEKGDERAASEAQREIDKIKLTKQLAEQEAKIKEDQDKKARKLARDQAIASKAFSLAEAIFKTAQSVAAAIAAFPITGGLPFSALNAALGAVQIAKISSQPIPALATGGTIETSGPQLFLAGDNASGRERVEVTPLDDAGGGATGGNTFIFHGIQDLDSARNELMRSEGADAFNQAF